MSNSKVVRINSATAAIPDLAVVEGQITTTSQQIAQHFGKRHDTVLRAISNLDCSPEFNARNFAAVEYTDAKGENRRAYRMTRDGFVFLAMGFTGKEAAIWKEAYIIAFNRMESELLARTTRPANPALDYDRISPAQAQDLKELVHQIVEAKVQSFGETWMRLQRKFRVNSYHELPATRFGEARDYLQAKLPRSTARTAPPVTDAERIAIAFSVAAEAGAKVQSALFEQLTRGTPSDMVHGRVIASVGLDRQHKPTDPLAHAMRQDEFVTHLDTFPRQIVARDIRANDVQLASVISACTQVLSERATLRSSGK